MSASGRTAEQIQPFSISIPRATLDDLRERLARTRWPDEISEANWDYGANLAYMRELADYWQHNFDWRAQEAELNRFHHFRTQSGIHFVHEPSHVERDSGQPMPLLLLHGWPSTFVQFKKIIPLLTNPQVHGGQASDAFSVVAPSLVGYGFSDKPTQRGMSPARMAELFHELMLQLGYERYAIRGSDLGAGVLTQLALAHPEAVIGTHSGGTNPWVQFDQLPADLTPKEQQFVEDARQWNMSEMGYAMEHATKPQTLAYTLNDSPTGLAAWIVEKFRRWSDSDGDVERRFSKEDLCTTLTIYWATQTINSSIRLYFEAARDPGSWGTVGVPQALLMSSKDMFPTPKEWVERNGPVDRWTDIDRGGHFLEWEEPEVVAEDMRHFFRGLRR